MDFIFDLAFQVTLFIFFVISLGFFFYFLRDNKPWAVWSALAAWIFIGCALAFFAQHRIIMAGELSQGQRRHLTREQFHILVGKLKEIPKEWDV